MQTVIKRDDIIAETNRIKPKVRGFVNLSEDKRLFEDPLRPGIEKLQLFTTMLRRNAMFNNAVQTVNPK